MNPSTLSPGTFFCHPRSIVSGGGNQLPYLARDTDYDLIVFAQALNNNRVVQGISHNTRDFLRISVSSLELFPHNLSGCAHTLLRRRCMAFSNELENIYIDMPGG